MMLYSYTVDSTDNSADRFPQRSVGRIDWPITNNIKKF